jgi:hypothetical protein
LVERLLVPRGTISPVPGRSNAVVVLEIDDLARLERIIDCICATSALDAANLASDH